MSPESGVPDSGSAAPAGGDAPGERVVVVVECSEVIAELVSERLFAFGASAVATDDLRPAAQGSEHAQGPEHDRGAVVRLTADILADHLRDLDRLEFNGASPVWRVVDPGTAWLDAWKEHARIWQAGRFLIRPPWISSPGGQSVGGSDRAVESDELIELVVDPQYSFGSGSHPTTRACLDLLDRVVVPSEGAGGRVLDVGVGSGILGVAALKIGFATVLGIDIDPNALEQAPVVAEANGVGGRFAVSAQTVDELALDPQVQPHDLVFANLLIPVIEEIGADLMKLCSPGGSLIVSGLLVDQRDRALGALGGFEVRAEVSSEGWLALLLTRGSA